MLNPEVNLNGRTIVGRAPTLPRIEKSLFLPFLNETSQRTFVGDRAVIEIMLHFAGSKHRIHEHRIIVTLNAPASVSFAHL